LSDFQNTFRDFLNELRLESFLSLRGNVNPVDGETFRLGHRFYSVDTAPSGAPGGGGRILSMKRSIAKAISPRPDAKVTSVMGAPRKLLV
jgi:hypothetical protein